jgi:transposase
MIKNELAAQRFFPPLVALELTRIACEMPEKYGRSLCLWDCTELARELIRRSVVESISPQTVQRILNSHKLKPWRHHPWMNPTSPRDQEFIDRTKNICDIYTRPLQPHEIVLSVDEKTSLQPRSRTAETKPAMIKVPVRVEHEYKRDGALNLFAGINTRTGHVYGETFERKRQVEFIDFLQKVDDDVSHDIETIHIVCDNINIHSGKEVQKWLETHKRFTFHFTPKHCSWMNQIEQWFSILQRKRFTVTNFKSKKYLAEALKLFIDQWNEFAKPFKWKKRSFEKVLNKTEKKLKKAA